jgi:hypothetical protein
MWGISLRIPELSDAVFFFAKESLPFSDLWRLNRVASGCVKT